MQNSVGRVGGWVDSGWIGGWVLQIKIKHHLSPPKAEIGDELSKNESLVKSFVKKFGLAPN